MTMTDLPEPDLVHFGVLGEKRPDQWDDDDQRALANLVGERLGGPLLEGEAYSLSDAEFIVAARGFLTAMHRCRRLRILLNGGMPRAEAEIAMRHLDSGDAEVVSRAVTILAGD